MTRNLLEECLKRIKTQQRPRLCDKTNCAALSEAQLRLSHSLLSQGSEREAVTQLYNRDYFICQQNDPTVMKIKKKNSKNYNN